MQLAAVCPTVQRAVQGEQHLMLVSCSGVVFYVADFRFLSMVSMKKKKM
jgi:hypothetical protein